jgi:TrmH family RNA methyltransferase
VTSALDVITSRDNALVKELRKLKFDGAAYRKTGRIWLEGDHLVDAFFRSPLVEAGVRSVLVVTPEFFEKNQHLPSKEWASVATKNVVIESKLLHECSTLEAPASVGLLLELPSNPAVDAAAPTVILDRLQDPGNVGSILRTAAAMGYQQIMALKGTAALWTPKVLRAGMGAHFSLRLIEFAEADALAALQLPLAATSSHGGVYLHDLGSIDLLLNIEQNNEQRRWASAEKREKKLVLNWVFGHEGQGVAPALLDGANLKVRIAQPGGQESLNVAAAAAICLHASAMLAAAMESAVPRVSPQVAASAGLE